MMVDLQKMEEKMGKEFHKRYFISKELAKDLTKLSTAMYAESHPEAEINNPKPLFEALGIRKPLSMQEKLDRLFRGPRGLIEQMYEQGEETPEDFNDLDIPDDDVEPISPYEYHVMQEEKPSSLSTPSEPLTPDPSPPDGGPSPEPEATPPKTPDRQSEQ
jgi:hypothetical protein